ncbi:MAG: toll/interleukin-1 receptor domain-containing protein [Aulosira sp. DedQUE10]|nr:toll/interleukin-1 receptor domain-containing protein [Aulosira sp. DedQUE10]
MPSTKVIELFYCCSDSEQDEQMRQKLEDHLSILKRQNVIAGWHKGMISPGKEWESEIDTHLKSADIILLLISSDFIASDYYWEVVIKQALQRHKAKQARVIPVLLRPYDNWKKIFGNLKALPKGERPVTRWKPYDEAFRSIAEGIRETVEEITDPAFPIRKSFKQIREVVLPVGKFIGNILINMVSTTFSLLFRSSRIYRGRRTKIIPFGQFLVITVLSVIFLIPHISNLLEKRVSRHNVTPQSRKTVNSTGWIWIGITKNNSSQVSVGESLIKPSNSKLLPSIEPPVIPSPGAIVTVKYKVNLRK